MEQVGWQQELRRAAYGIKQERHGLVQGATLGHEEHAVEFFVPRAVKLKLLHLRLVETRKTHLHGALKDLRLRYACSMAEHAAAVIQEAVQLHVPQGDEPVEPRIGHLLHHLRKAFPLDLLRKTRPNGRRGMREGARADHGCIATPGGMRCALGIQTIERGTAGDRVDKFPSRLLGVGFEGAVVHTDWMYVYAIDAARI